MINIDLIPQKNMLVLYSEEIVPVSGIRDLIFIPKDNKIDISLITAKSPWENFIVSSDFSFEYNSVGGVHKNVIRFFSKEININKISGLSKLDYFSMSILQRNKKGDLKASVIEQASIHKVFIMDETKIDIIINDYNIV